MDLRHGSLRHEPRQGRVSPGGNDRTRTVGTGHPETVNDRARHLPAEATTWASGAGEPRAAVTITWAVDAHDTTIVDLSGEMCTLTERRIRGLITGVAETSKGDVAIDASEVTFIDSRCLSLLLGTCNRLAERGLRCRVVNPSRIVRRLFELVRVDDLPPKRADGRPTSKLDVRAGRSPHRSSQPA